MLQTKLGNSYVARMPICLSKKLILRGPITNLGTGNFKFLLILRLSVYTIS